MMIKFEVGKTYKAANGRLYTVQAINKGALRVKRDDGVMGSRTLKGEVPGDSHLNLVQEVDGNRDADTIISTPPGATIDQARSQPTECHCPISWHGIDHNQNCTHHKPQPVAPNAWGIPRVEQKTHEEIQNNAKTSSDNKSLDDDIKYSISMTIRFQ